MAAILPSLFVSHGSPALALDPGPAGAFWHELAGRLPRPRAVLCVSAHWNTLAPVVNSPTELDTIYDFYGFPDPLYRLTYRAPGAPFLAERVRTLLGEAGIPCGIDPERGLDHGAWVPLRSFYPEADIPVMQLSVQPRRDANWHFRLGAALAPLLREGVLILGSGGATHNLYELDRKSGPAPAWAKEFDDWLAAALAGGQCDEVLDWETKAPNALRAHPSPEHFLPLFVAWGAAGNGARGVRLYGGFTLGGLSMAAFEFAV